VVDEMSMDHGMVEENILSTKLQSWKKTNILTHGEISTELRDFYKDLLTYPPIDRTPTIDRVTQNIPNIISPEQNMALM
jgi:hypothetical protein